MSVVKLLSAKDARGYGYTLDTLVETVNHRVKSGSIFRECLFQLGNNAYETVKYGWFKKKTVLKDEIYREFYDLLIANGYKVEIIVFKNSDSTWLKVTW